MLDVKPVIPLCSSFGWRVHVNDGHEFSEIILPWKTSDINTKPTIIFYNTIKGYGVDYMVNDPVEWHYKQLV